MINLDKLVFSISTDADDFSKLDCKEKDGSDPLGVDDFIHSKLQLYRKNNLSTVYTVRYENSIVAFFTTSMAGIEAKELSEEDKIPAYTPREYPAMLLGNMGVDRNFQNQGIGKAICNYCLGLGQDINKRVACAAVCLKTDKSRILYYEEKCGFRYSKKQEQKSKIWMYRKLVVIRSINEEERIKEDVNAVLNADDPNKRKEIS